MDFKDESLGDWTWAAHFGGLSRVLGRRTSTTCSLSVYRGLEELGRTYTLNSPFQGPLFYSWNC